MLAGLLIVFSCGCNDKDNISSTDSMSENNSSIGDIELYETVFESETAWLASLQLDNGAIPMTSAKNGAVSMNPYFADFAALALLDAPDKYSTNVKKYLEWHFAHLNTAQQDYNGVDGTIYDYKIIVSNGKVTGEEISVDEGKKQYDSTDSYAATFLTVLAKYYKQTGDKDYIISERKNIVRVVNAMLSTMDNGLTMAKPDYKIKYLMDNCEVYEGAISATQIFEEVICPSDSEYNDMLIKCKEISKQVYDAIESELWNISGNYYEAGIFKNGEVAYSFSWDTFYPCATAQLFPVMFGIIEPESERAKYLYNEFCKHFNWENFDIPDSFYWGSNVYAAALMGDAERVDCYLSYYKKIMKKHAYPLYNADAAKVCMGAYIMLQNNQ